MSQRSTPIADANYFNQKWCTNASHQTEFSQHTLEVTENSGEDCESRHAVTAFGHSSKIVTGIYQLSVGIPTGNR